MNFRSSKLTFLKNALNILLIGIVSYCSSVCSQQQQQQQQQQQHQQNYANSLFETCGKTSQHSRNYIYGGKPTMIEQWPWQVFVISAILRDKT
jgi:hypothetical protein